MLEKSLFEVMLAVIAVFWVLPALLIGFLLGSKRQAGFWVTFVLCLALSPVIGLVIALISGKREPEDDGGMNRFVQEQSVAAEIERLHRLKESGVISAEEFERFKSNLLKQPS